jgi:uracil-DNA glycosylase
MNAPMTYTQCLHEFMKLHADRTTCWSQLPFFQNGDAHKIMCLLDQRVSSGETILPSPVDIFNALIFTSLEDVKVVILGQDPYPTLGDAHGLAFSYFGTQRLPASLRNIFKELSSDMNVRFPQSGNLTPWAKQGVLLLNTALSVTARQAGSHLKLGWDSLTRDVITAISEQRPHVVFVLWGHKAQGYSDLIRPNHTILKATHPSPLSAYQGFLGSRPFSQANTALSKQGQELIDWTL